MSEIPICPEGSNVLVEVEEVKDRTDGGIWVPEIAKDNSRQICTVGMLVGIGPATSLAYRKGGEAVEVKQGDLPIKVAFARYGGSPINIGGRHNMRRYRLMTEADIVAFLFDDNIDMPREV